MTPVQYTSMGPMYFVFCRLYPSSPSTTAVFCSYLSSLYSTLNLTLYRGCGLAYPYDWRGFVGAKKKMSVGLFSIQSSLVQKHTVHHRVDRMLVLSFFSSRWNWDFSPAGEWARSLAGEGVGGPNPNE
jgi:hypothetical protein